MEANACKSAERQRFVGGNHRGRPRRAGAYAYLGMTVPDFPNFFMLYGPNTNVGSNSVIFMLEAQARYIVRALKHMRRKRKAYVAVRPKTMADFIAKIDGWMEGTVWLTRAGRRSCSQIVWTRRCGISCRLGRTCRRACCGSSVIH
jgi:hypothetical protein